MALPKLDSPTYETELPSTGKKIKYRPFLVKEQKILLMSQESKDTMEQMMSMGKLINSCTFGEIDANTSPLFDIEYLFLKIREKSVGAKVTIMVTCPDDNETKVPVKINLEEINVQMTVGHSNEIKLSEKMKLIMKYPLLKDIAKTENAGKMQTTGIFDILNQCVHEIHHDDTIYHKVDMTDKDLEEFIDSFSTQQFELVTEFFETMPKLRHAVNITNPKTNVKSEVVIEGLDSFLV
jgi:hypothetical protein